MKKSRGFTLVELLAVIAILGILLSVSTVAVFNIRKGQDEKNRQNLIINILAKAKEYVADHPEELDNSPTEVPVSELNVNFNKKQSGIYSILNVKITKCDGYKFKYSIKVGNDTYNDCGCESQDTGSVQEICTD